MVLSLCRSRSILFFNAQSDSSWYVRFWGWLAGQRKISQKEKDCAFCSARYSGYLPGHTSLPASMWWPRLMMIQIWLNLNLELIQVSLLVTAAILIRIRNGPILLDQLPSLHRLRCCLCRVQVLILCAIFVCPVFLGNPTWNWTSGLQRLLLSVRSCSLCKATTIASCWNTTGRTSLQTTCAWKVEATHPARHEPQCS